MAILGSKCDFWTVPSCTVMTVPKFWMTAWHRRSWHQSSDRFLTNRTVTPSLHSSGYEALAEKVEFTSRLIRHVRGDSQLWC
jgi:hypothetical protein